MEEKQKTCTTVYCTWVEPMTSGFFPMRTCNILFSFTFRDVFFTRCYCYCWNNFKCLWASLSDNFFSYKNNFFYSIEIKLKEQQYIESRDRNVASFFVIPFCCCFHSFLHTLLIHFFFVIWSRLYFST